MTWLEEIADRLVGQGIVEGSSGWEVSVDRMRDDPDRVIGLFGLEGFQPETKGSPLKQPGLQVRVRGGSNEGSEARTKAEEVRDDLHRIAGATLGAAHYVHVIATSEPVSIGEDDNERPEFTVNFNVAREE